MKFGKTFTNIFNLLKIDITKGKAIIKVDDAENLFYKEIYEVAAIIKSLDIAEMNKNPEIKSIVQEFMQNKTAMDLYGNEEWYVKTKKGLEDKEWYDNYDEVIERVKKDGLMLSCASDRLKNNRDVVEAAVENNKMALFFASQEMIFDKKLLESCKSLFEDDAGTTYRMDCLGQKVDIYTKAQSKLFYYQEQERVIREQKLSSRLAELEKIEVKQKAEGKQSRIEVKPRRKI